MYGSYRLLNDVYPKPNVIARRVFSPTIAKHPFREVSSRTIYPKIACLEGDCPLRFASGMGLPKQTHVLRSDFPKGTLRSRKKRSPPPLRYEGLRRLRQ